MRFRICKILLVLCVCCNCFGAWYNVSNTGISDHANASETGSLAWYLATYGGGTQTSPNTFALTSSTTYVLKNTVNLPAWGRITESGVNAYLRCDDNWVDDSTHEVFTMHEGSIILHVEIDCNWKPSLGIRGDNCNSWQLIDVTIHGTKKANPSYIIHLASCDWVIIRDCLLRRAGCDTNEEYFYRVGNGIRAVDCENLTIEGCDIAVTPSAGIAMAQGKNIDIIDNYIHDTGRAQYAGYIQDGITSYHAGMGTTYRHIYVSENYIWDSRNHGVHLSGYDLIVHSNVIWNSGANNIRLGDQTSPEDCTAYSSVMYNELLNKSSMSSIDIDHYKSGTITISNNTGYTDVKWEGGTCN